MVLAKSCQNLNKEDSGWYCIYYQKWVENCGDDCPNYKYSPVKEVFNE
jgi:hypothetical protein